MYVKETLRTHRHILNILWDSKLKYPIGIEAEPNLTYAYKKQCMQFLAFWLELFNTLRGEVTIDNRFQHMTHLPRFQHMNFTSISQTITYTYIKTSNLPILPVIVESLEKHNDLEKKVQVLILGPKWAK